MTKLIISPKLFKEKFVSVIGNYKTEIANLWYKAPDYTLLMLGENNKSGGVLPEVAEELNLKYFREYWTLDAIFYESKDIEHFPQNSVVASYLSIILEHENVIATTYDETNKLSNFNVPLKVLIAYPHKESDIKEYLFNYAQILQNADTFSDFSTLRKHLVIFGELKDAEPSWRFYVYKNAKFSEV